MHDGVEPGHDIKLETLRVVGPQGGKGKLEEAADDHKDVKDHEHLEQIVEHDVGGARGQPLPLFLGNGPEGEDVDENPGQGCGEDDVVQDLQHDCSVFVSLGKRDQLTSDGLGGHVVSGMRIARHDLLLFHCAVFLSWSCAKVGTNLC